jgi:hypothetical protein
MLNMIHESASPVGVDASNGNLLERGAHLQRVYREKSDRAAGMTRSGKTGLTRTSCVSPAFGAELAVLKILYQTERGGEWNLRPARANPRRHKPISWGVPSVARDHRGYEKVKASRQVSPIKSFSQHLAAGKDLQMLKALELRRSNRTNQLHLIQGFHRRSIILIAGAAIASNLHNENPRTERHFGAPASLSLVFPPSVFAVEFALHSGASHSSC